MKVLHINHFGFSRGGGSGNAMRLLHLGLREAGIDSKVLCWNEPETIPDVIRIKPSGYQRKLEALLGRVTARLSLNDINRVSSFCLKNHPAFLEADVINFHILNGWFSYLALPFLTREKPAVWSLHDMWGFTGHCYYSLDCERWKTGCGRCPYPETFPQIQRDNTRIEWKLKDWSYRRSNLDIVTSSKWLTGLVGESMLQRFRIHQIPYGIDVEAYRPLDKIQCRVALDLPLDKKVLLVAADSLRNPIKGMDLLRQALAQLPNGVKSNCVLLAFGNGGEGLAQAVDIPISYLGYLKSDRLKTLAYSAADLFLFPSRAETFGLVALESMACGTPVVSFRTSGVVEHVRPGITGYLAKPESSEDFCRGVVELLDDDRARERLGKQGRSMAVKEYSSKLYVQRYIELYRQLVDRSETGNGRVATTSSDDHKAGRRQEHVEARL